MCFDIRKYLDFGPLAKMLSICETYVAIIRVPVLVIKNLDISRANLHEDIQDGPKRLQEVPMAIPEQPKKYQEKTKKVPRAPHEEPKGRKI